MQRRSNLPLTKVHKEDGKAYMEALKVLKEKDDLKAFQTFMVKQHIKTIKTETKAGFALCFKGGFFMCIFVSAFIKTMMMRLETQDWHLRSMLIFKDKTYGKN